MILLFKHFPVKALCVKESVELSLSGATRSLNGSKFKGLKAKFELERGHRYGRLIVKLLTS